MAAISAFFVGIVQDVTLESRLVWLGQSFQGCMAVIFLGLFRPLFPSGRVFEVRVTLVDLRISLSVVNVEMILSS